MKKEHFTYSKHLAVHSLEWMLSLLLMLRARYG